MSRDSLDKNQPQLSPAYGHVVAIIFKIGRYVYLPLAVISGIGWAFGVIPWYLFPVLAFGFVYIEFRRRRFLREIPFYAET